jgi:hypothetical protein
MEDGLRCLAGFIGIDLDVVAHAVGGEEAKDALGGEVLLLGDDVIEQRLRVLIEFERLLLQTLRRL